MQCLKAGFAAILLLVAITATSAVYTEFESAGKSQCFVIDAPENTLVTIHYRSPDQEATHDGASSRLHLRVLGRAADPDHPSRILYPDFVSIWSDKEGHIVFQTQLPGENFFCAGPVEDPNFFNEPPGRKLRLFFKIDKGSAAVDYQKIARAEQLSDMEVAVRKLEGVLNDIRASQAYEAYMEVEFERLTLRVKRRISIWASVQCILFGVIAYVELQYLKMFFRAKKLV